MREVFSSDLTAAARHLLAVPHDLREDVCAQLLREADWADKFAKRMGKPHPRWGNGTLMAVSRTRQMMPEKSFSDPEYVLCFAVILQCLQRHRAGKACKSRLHAHMKN